MAWFRCVDVLHGSVLSYEIRNGLFEVRDPKHISILKKEPQRFVPITEEQVKQLSAPPIPVPAEKPKAKPEKAEEAVSVPKTLPSSTLLGGGSELKTVKKPEEEKEEDKPEEKDEPEKVAITSEDVGKVEDVLDMPEPEPEKPKSAKKVKKASSKKKKKKTAKKSGKKVKKAKETADSEIVDDPEKKDE